MRQSTLWYLQSPQNVHTYMCTYTLWCHVCKHQSPQTKRVHFEHIRSTWKHVRHHVWGKFMESEYFSICFSLACDWTRLLKLETCGRRVSCEATATHCNTLQHTATHCNTLQHTAMETCGRRGIMWGCRVSGYTQLLCEATATHCNTLQHTATHCNTLQHTATHCNTLQHTICMYIHAFKYMTLWCEAI